MTRGGATVRTTPVRVRAAKRNTIQIVLSRAAALRLFIEHAQAQPGVAFMRRSDIARWWLEQYPPA